MKKIILSIFVFGFLFAACSKKEAPVEAKKPAGAKSATAGSQALAQLPDCRELYLKLSTCQVFTCAMPLDMFDEALYMRMSVKGWQGSTCAYTQIVTDGEEEEEILNCSFNADNLRSLAEYARAFAAYTAGEQAQTFNLPNPMDGFLETGICTMPV